MFGWQIAAQKKKNRPVSPESESNWDSSDAENSAPHISSDDDEASIVSSKSKGRTVTLSKENNNCKLSAAGVSTKTGGHSDMNVCTCMTNGFEIYPGGGHTLVMMQRSLFLKTKILWDFASYLTPKGP